MTKSGIPAFETPTQIPANEGLGIPRTAPSSVAQRDAPVLLVMSRTSMRAGPHRSVTHTSTRSELTAGNRAGWFRQGPDRRRVSTVLIAPIWRRACGRPAGLCRTGLGQAERSGTSAGFCPAARLWWIAATIGRGPWVARWLGWPGAWVPPFRFAGSYAAGLVHSGLAAALLIVAASVVQALQRTPTNVDNTGGLSSWPWQPWRSASLPSEQIVRRSSTLKNGRSRK